MAELLLAAVLAAAAVTIIVALMPRAGQVPRPAGPTQPVASSPASPSPTVSPTALSTVAAPPPLILYWNSNAADPLVFAARTYDGRPAGTLTVPQSYSGYDIAPDGSRVLDGNQIFSVRGDAVATITWPFAELPIWADDSAHLCGVTPGNQSVGSLVEFDMSGRTRTVATLGPLAASGGWQMLACSTSADRAVVAETSGSATSVLVIRLSAGGVIARHAVGGSSLTTAVATHDGRIVAVNEPSGVVVRDAVTWAIRARVVRWGSQMGYPVIGRAMNVSWDGSRLVIDGGGASGVFHPVWIVDWARNVDVVANIGPHPLLAVVGDAVPLISGSQFFLPPGEATSSRPSPPYLINARGQLQRLPQ